MNLKAKVVGTMHARILTSDHVYAVGDNQGPISLRFYFHLVYIAAWYVWEKH